MLCVADCSCEYLVLPMDLQHFRCIPWTDINEPSYTFFVLSQSPYLPIYYNRATREILYSWLFQTDAYAALFVVL
jgi:hypothetical protein